MVNQYGQDEMEDPMEALTEIKQHGSVLEYLKQFIKVSHLIEGMPMNHIISCFIAGLRKDIRPLMKKQKPQMVVDAYKMACVE